MAAVSSFSGSDLVAPTGFCMAPWGTESHYPPPFLPPGPRLATLLAGLLRDFWWVDRVVCGTHSIKDHIFVDYHSCAQGEVGTWEINMNQSISMHGLM